LILTNLKPFFITLPYYTLTIHYLTSQRLTQYYIRTPGTQVLENKVFILREAQPGRPSYLNKNCYKIAQGIQVLENEVFILRFLNASRSSPSSFGFNNAHIFDNIIANH
jgi:hypothetical protein